MAILGIKEVPGTMGADRVVEKLLEHLPARHRYTVYVARTAGSPSTAGPNVRFVRVPSARGKHLFAGSYFALASLHAALLGRYDVVHVHNSDFGLFCLPLRLRRRVRIVGTFHGDPYRRVKWGRFARTFLRLSEWCFIRSADVLTSVSPTKSVPGSEVRYIPNGIEQRQEDLPDASATLGGYGLATGAYVMFACGRLDATKGLHHLIDAYRLVPTAPQMLVVGDFTHDEAYATRMVQAAGGDPRIVLETHLLPRDQLLALAYRSRVFVFPSEVEGMSMMLVEAVGVGATVVCSDIPENRAVVGNDYPLLFCNRDPHSLAETLTRALASETSHAVAPARARISREFRWDAIAQQYADLYVSGSGRR